VAGGGEHDEPGALVVVATPIGNLGDLSRRAVDELGRADLICCEDTRRTGKLLAHAGITAPPLRRVDAYTEAKEAEVVAERIAAGQRVVLVTDAGTPGVSDPGARLVAAIVAAGLPVTAVPGPVAAVTALVVSGFDTARFAVEGFLPRSGPERSSRLAELAAEHRTSIVYEAPTRTARTLADLRQACGPDRRVAVARELTKLHEEVWRGTLDEAVQWATSAPLRGEVVLVLAGVPGGPSSGDDEEVRAALRAARGRGMPPGRAAADVAAAMGRPRGEVYALALALDADTGPIEPRTRADGESSGEPDDAAW
jgi:16S rRNA (cytidine1402-2'-O)-methyltransferase